jgi:methylaspartate mutase sigma subunit
MQKPMTAPDPQSIHIVTGTIGDDIHSFGIKVINHALESAGFRVVSLGIQTPQEDFVKAAMESDAKAILVSSMSGHARLLCEGLRANCTEAGLGDIVLYVGGTLSTGDTPWPELQQIFLDMGYTRVFPATTMPGEIITALKQDLAIPA